jgi:glutamine amidotransferase
MIAIVDYGRGHLGSVEKAFARVGTEALVTQEPRLVERAEAVVLPGDGAFHDAMQNLETLGLLGPIRECLEAERPFLGICLGYQLLFSESEEFGHGKGLDVIPGVVRRFPKTLKLKVPHMGWNQVVHSGDLAIFDGIPSGAYFYFVHSYYPEARPGDCVAGPGPLRQAWCDYGVRFTAAIERHVRAHPDQRSWVHRRWKTQPAWGGGAARPAWPGRWRRSLS